MPDIKSILSEEIRRLAKKEVKAALLPLQKTISEQRKTISEMKKRIAKLENISVSAGKTKCEKENSCNAEKEIKLRLNTAGIIRVRNKLKLTQNEFAKLLGVSIHTVSTWEQGKSAPRKDARAAICALRTIGKRELKRRLAELTSDAE